MDHTSIADAEARTASSSSTSTSGGPSTALAVLGFVAAGVAAAFTLVATADGPGLSPDSVNYISSGLNLADGEGLRNFAGDTLTDFPPGLPVIVALGDWFGLSHEWTLRLFNAAVIGGAVYLGCVLLARHVRSRQLVGFFTVLLGVSLPLLKIGRMAWTEPVFLFITLAFILVLERAVMITERPSVRLLLCGAVLTWIAFGFRYAGVALVTTGGVALLLGRSPRGWRDSAVSAGIFVALAAAIPAAWMIRNLSVDGNLMGPRSASTDGPVLVVKRFAGVLGEWVLPPPFPGSLQHVAGVVVLVGAVAALGWFLLATRRQLSENSSVGELLSYSPLVTFVAVYAAYLTTAQILVAFDPIDSRLASPLFVPLVVLGAIALDRLTALVPADRRSSVTFAIATMLALFVVGQGLAFLAGASKFAVEGAGYQADSWQQSELAEGVSNLPTGANLYSNSPYGIWAATGHEPVMFSPKERAGRSNEVPGRPTAFLQAVECSPAFLAWFEDGSRNDLFDPKALREYVELSVVASFSDGDLYRIEPTSTDGAECEAQTAS